jgi:hypothetical protein
LGGHCGNAANGGVISSSHHNTFAHPISAVGTEKCNIPVFKY